MKLLRTSPRLLGFVLALGAGTFGTLNSQATAQTSDLVERYMTPVQTELAGKVDTRNAAAGQTVTLLIRRPATLADGTEIPKGSKVVGHILEVHASNGDRAGSTITLLFDRVELAGGKALPVRSMMRTLTPTSAATGQNDGIRADQRGMAPGGAVDPRVMDAGGLNSRGLGGLGSSDPSGGGMGGTRASRRSQGTTSSAPAMIPDTVSSNSDQNASTRHEGETVGSAPIPTGLEGVLLAKRVAGSGAAGPAGTGPSGAAADTSGTLIGIGRNIRLDGGTVIVLGVIGR